MFDDLKTYGIISVLLILVLGYFVYIIYRDNIVLKNELKEIREFFHSEQEEIDEDMGMQEFDEDDIEMEELEEEQPIVFEDVNAYFSHIKPTELPVIEELPQEEVVEEKTKKRKRSKKTPAPEVQPEVLEVPEE